MELKKTEFTFKYYPRSRHLFPDYDKLFAPFNAIEKLGGIIVVQREFVGTDRTEGNYYGNFIFKFREYEFRGHKIKAFCVQESTPGEKRRKAKDLADAIENPSPEYITRVRLGNYHFTDSFNEKLVASLSEIPEDIYENFPLMSRLA